MVGDQGRYLVMDFIDGEDLRQRMERVGTISEDEAVMIGAAMCDALNHLHTRKPAMVDGYLEPGNEKITPEGHIFLVDFGLAKVVHGQPGNHDRRARDDPGIFSAGTRRHGPHRSAHRTRALVAKHLYAALTGIIPEDGLARAMDNAQLTPLRKRNSKVSRRLAAAIEQSMAIDPADRYQFAGDPPEGLLGSKSKSQHLPGKLTISAASPWIVEIAGMVSRMDHRRSRLVSKPGVLMAEPENEFKPPKRKKKRRRGCFLQFLLILLLLVGGVGAASYYYPNLVPPSVSPYLPWILSTPVEAIPLASTETPTAEPTLTSLLALLNSLPPMRLRRPLHPSLRQQRSQRKHRQLRLPHPKHRSGVDMARSLLPRSGSGCRRFI